MVAKLIKNWINTIKKGEADNTNSPKKPNILTDFLHIILFVFYS